MKPIILFTVTMFLSASCEKPGSDAPAQPQAQLQPQPAFVFTAEQRRVALELIREDIFDDGKNRESGLLPVLYDENIVSPVELHDAYHANELAADQKFKNKNIVILGTVATVSSTLGQSFVRLEAGTFRFVHAKARDPADPQLLKIKRGDKVKLLCMGGGMTLTNPAVNDCVFFSSVQESLAKKLLELTEKLLAQPTSFELQDYRRDILVLSTATILAITPFTSSCKQEQNIKSCIDDRKPRKDQINEQTEAAIRFLDQRGVHLTSPL